MHYTISYNALTPNAAHAKALNDIVQYLGGKRFGELHKLFCNLRDTEGWLPTREGFRMHLAFAGIEGYPCDVWYAEIWPFG
jgi:hypothetical protein